jgi:hypothetical protein
MQCLERPAVPCNVSPSASGTSGTKSWSTNSLPDGLVRLVPRLATRRPKAGRLGAGRRQQRRQPVGVIAVRVRDEDVRHAAAADRLQVARDGADRRAGIDQGQSRVPTM